MDGSQKLPQRLLNTIRKCIDNGLPFDRLALGVAAWMRYVTGADEKGDAIDVRDPLAAELKKRAANKNNAEELVTAFIGMDQIFGRDLPENEAFVQLVKTQLAKLMRLGAAKTVTQIV